MGSFVVFTFCWHLGKAITFTCNKIFWNSILPKVRRIQKKKSPWELSTHNHFGSPERKRWGFPRIFDWRLETLIKWKFIHSNSFLGTNFYPSKRNITTRSNQPAQSFKLLGCPIVSSSLSPPSAASIHTALRLELQGAPVVVGDPNIPPSQYLSPMEQFGKYEKFWLPSWFCTSKKSIMVSEKGLQPH